jgi:hypothetical protein
MRGAEGVDVDYAPGVAQEINRIDQYVLHTGAKRAIPLLSGWAVKLDSAIPGREAEFCACKAEG